MSYAKKVVKEIRAVLVTTLYFAFCFGLLVLLKRLYLAEYQIEFRGLSLALVGALIAAKVVLVLEHVSLGQWIRAHPVMLEVVLRTLLYMLGALVVLMLEKGFEARHEHGGFFPGVVWVFEHRNVSHVWADVVGVGGALLGFNVLVVVGRHLGEGELQRLFFSRPQKESGTQTAKKENKHA